MADKSKALQKLLSGGADEIRTAIAKLRGQAPSIVEDVIVEDPRLVKQAASRVLPDIETTAVNLADDLALPPASGGGMLPPVASVADDIIGAVPPSSSLPNMAVPFLAAGALGAGAAGMMTDDSYTQPVDTSVPTSVLSNANRQLPKGTKPDTKAPSQKQANKAKDDITDAFKESLTPSAEVPKDDFDEKLAGARSKDDDRELMFGLLRAAQQGGSAIARTNADTSFADMNLSDKNKNVNRLTADEKAKKDRKEVTDEDILRDPNSDISKQARSIAAKVGLKIGPNVTAQQLKSAGLPIGNLLTQQMAIEARKEQSALQREMLRESKLDKAELAKEKANLKERDGVDKLVGNLMKSDDYKGYQAAKTAKAALDNALLEKNKASIGSAFMMYAKIAQGDNSVVRESDMKNLAGSYNYASPTEMINKLYAKAKGAGFTELEMKQMRQVADIIQQTKAKHIQEQLSPIKVRVEKYGLNPAESIDPSILREMDDIETDQALTTISKKAEKAAPTGPVTIRSLKTGSVRTLSPENAAKYLNDPAFERVR